MADLLIKFVTVKNGTDTWYQMANKKESLPAVEDTHIERWFFLRHEKGDSLMLKQKSPTNKLPSFLAYAVGQHY